MPDFYQMIFELVLSILILIYVILLTIIYIGPRKQVIFKIQFNNNFFDYRKNWTVEELDRGLTFILIKAKNVKNTQIN